MHKPAAIFVWVALTFTVVLSYCGAVFFHGKLRCIVIDIFNLYLEKYRAIQKLTRFSVLNIKTNLKEQQHRHQNELNSTIWISEQNKKPSVLELPQSNLLSIGFQSHS